MAEQSPDGVNEKILNKVVYLFVATMNIIGEKRYNFKKICKRKLL